MRTAVEPAPALERLVPAAAQESAAAKRQKERMEASRVTRVRPEGTLRRLLRSEPRPTSPIESTGEKARGHALHHIPKVHEYNRLVRPF